jgi:propanol-preferring alcohol dehydrogenase
MARMTAFRLMAWQRPAQRVEVEVPVPGPGEVLIKVAGVGLCHSDLLLLDEPEGRFDIPVPFTLGHEIAGWVAECGPEVHDLREGDAVVVSSRPSCGYCSYCLVGYDNYCENSTSGLGFGRDGGLANYVLARRRALVPLRSLDPRQAGPLADAGRTSYHVVKRALPKLVPGSTAVVIGVGGLGGYAVQYLRLLTEARVIAVDIAPHRLESARRAGVDDTVLAGGSDATVTDRLRELTGGRGAEVVFDFVGSDDTIETSLACARILGTIALVGAAGGTARVSWLTIPRECDIYIPQGGSVKDLQEVVAIAERGELRLDNELFGFDRVDEAYERLRSGDLHGRAVVTPNG